MVIGSTLDHEIGALFFYIVDLSVFVIANLTNLLLAIMFVFRARDKVRIGNGFGWISVTLGIPLIAVIVINALGMRPWWTIVLPTLMVTYDLAEFLLDFVLKFDFRHSHWIGPYLGLYYLALMGMIGYSFTIGRPFGFITLATYFVSQTATAYSQSRNRLHG
jgi:hypothetical protein